MTRALMFQGTGSDVGKSTFVAGLGRALVRRGLKVRPFKPQNMSNNAAVTEDGGEIGRAQALQAQACRVAPSVHMNPVLLKPESSHRSQVVLRGRRAGVLEARDFLTGRGSYLPLVRESFAEVCRDADLVLVEGAGSASEVNLRARDIANWGFARAAGVPVVLVGDIDRGGVIASLVGTKVVLAPDDAALVRGFVINKLRGDARLFAEGVTAITAHTQWPCFGVLPWVDACQRLPAEDGVVLEQPRRASATALASNGAATDRRLLVCVLHLPSVANFDDLDPLAAEPDVDLCFLRAGEPIPGHAAVVILPGSKSTRDDLAFLRAAGWDVDLAAHVRRGGFVLGLCGGYQMLGQAIDDPRGLEGPAGRSPGLGLLDVTTTLVEEKTLARVEGVHRPSGQPLAGYEIHLGVTDGPDARRPWCALRAATSPSEELRPDGATDATGRIAGTYLHGLFASDAFRRYCLSQWGAPSAGSWGFASTVEAALDALADAIEGHCDVDALLAAAAVVS